MTKHLPEPRSFWNISGCRRNTTILSLLGLSLLALSTVGCRSEMYDQPRYEPLEPSTLFADGKSARNLVAGTIPRGWSRTNEHLFEGRIDGQLVNDFPFVIDEAILLRGKERYQIFCTPCHGDLGDGDGMIIRRGFPAPPTFHSDRLRDIPVGHFFDVMTRGFGAMYSYEHRVKPEDRWAIAAYIRALQLSQRIHVNEYSGLDESEIQQGLSTQKTMDPAHLSVEAQKQQMEVEAGQ